MKWIKRIMRALIIIFIILWPIYLIIIKDDEELHKEESWKGIITLWDYPRLDIEKGTRYNWITDIIDDFEKNHPGVYVEFQPLDWDSGPMKLEAALKTSALPDIAPVATEYEYMDEEVLEPLNQYIDEIGGDIFKYQTLEAVSNSGNIYGIPFMMTSYGIYINLDIFNKRGVEPPNNGNWTYEEFVDKMKKLTYDEDGDGDIDHYGFTSFVESNKYSLWGFMLSDGGNILEGNDYSFNDEKSLSGLKKIVDLKYKYNVTPENFGLDTENETWTQFYQEKTIAAYPAGSWAYRVLEEGKRSGKGFNFTVTNYPIGDKEVPRSLNNSVAAYGIKKQEDEKKIELCVELLKSVIKKENQLKLKNMGVFSVRKDLDNLYPDNVEMNKLNSYIKYSVPLPRHRKWNDMDRILQNQIRLAVIGDKAPEEALKEADSQIKLLLKD